MRRGTTGTMLVTSPIVNGPQDKTGGQFIGVKFGVDGCAEQEMGIDELKKAFGISNKPTRIKGFSRLIKPDLIGADARTITTLPKGLRFFEDLAGYAYLVYDKRLAGQTTWSSKELDEIMDGSHHYEPLASWDYRSFGIRIKNDALNIGATLLGQLYEAFKRKDVMIYIGKSTPFGDSAFTIAIRSRLSKEVFEEMKRRDEDYLDLMEEVEKIDLAAKLQAAGKEYFALSPRWNKDNFARESAYKVIYWLNPYHQDENNYGWYSVEELLQWIKGEGPIPKAKAA